MTTAGPPGPPAAAPARSREAVPDADALAATLAAHGLVCDVQARGALAVLAVPAHRLTAVLAILADDTRRDEVNSASHTHGFTNVALELREEDY